MSKLKSITIILVLLFLTVLLSKAQELSQDRVIEVFLDFRGIPMVFVPSGEVHSGIELDEAVSQCLSLRQKEGFPPYDPDQICDPDFLSTSIAETTTISLNAFYIDQYEVSRSNYVECIEADVCSIEPLMRQPLEPSDVPVQYPTYYDAAIYCAWREARLPTAFEWEYAARGPESLTFTWGNDFDGTLTNHCDVNCTVLGDAASQSIWNDGFSELAPVDVFEGDQSWIGAYNLAGNILEWTSTRSVLNQSPNDDLRVIKGGSYDSFPYHTAGWFEGSHNSNHGRANIGFRCVRTTES